MYVNSIFSHISDIIMSFLNFGNLLIAVAFSFLLKPQISAGRIHREFIGIVSL